MMNGVRPLALACLLLLPRAGGAQEGVPSSLSLEQALEIARGNNPGFRQTLNDADLAD